MDDIKNILSDLANEWPRFVIVQRCQVFDLIFNASLHPDMEMPRDEVAMLISLGLNNSSLNVRSAALTSMESLFISTLFTGDEIFEIIEEGIQDTNPGVRYQALCLAGQESVVGKLSMDNFCAIIESGLASGKQDLNVGALELLGHPVVADKIRGKKFFEYLEAGSGSKFMKVKQTAAEIAQQYKSRLTEGQLAQICPVKPASEDGCPFVAFAALERLVTGAQP